MLLHIDIPSNMVYINGDFTKLTKNEYKLLVYMAKKNSKIASRGELLENVWGATSDMNTRTVDMHISRLKRKLGPAGKLIETIHGFGYRIRPNKTK